MNLFNKFYSFVVFELLPLAQKVVLTVRDEGLKIFFLKTAGFLKIKTKIMQFEYRPRISLIIPVYNVEENWLRMAIDSVTTQLYTNWELCIVDDASTKTHIKQILNKYANKDQRIKVAFHQHNQGVSAASNKAAQIATGEYVALMDHDDELARDALYEIVKILNSQDADIVYTDEHFTDADGVRFWSHFKPDFSPDLLLSHNYITHLLVIKKILFDEIGGFRSNYDGAQDYDLILRLSEKSDKIHHIPKALYNWRQHPSSVSIHQDSKPLAVEAGRAALQDTLRRRNIQGEVEKVDGLGFYRVRRELVNQPLISIIIPFKDKPHLLKTCIESVLKKTRFHNYEIICIDNNSIEQDTFDVINQLQNADDRLSFTKYDVPFNFSKINNYGASLANGEHIVLMNNDIEIINNDWIDVLLEHSQREEVGAVGGKLYYPDETIQHAGVIVGIGGHAGHSHKHLKRKSKGYFHRPLCIQNISAVTGALLMVKKRLFEMMGGLDEVKFSIAFNDIDFCLRLRANGYLNIYTPYCEAYHHESASRGYEDTPEKKARFKIEIGHFRERWDDILATGDPYYNVNLTIEKEDFSFKEI